MQVRNLLTAIEYFGLAWLAIGRLLTVALVEYLGTVPPFRRRHVYALSQAPGQRGFELGFAWQAIIDPIVLGLLVSSGALRLAAPSLGSSVLTFAAMFVWVDIWMYWTHRAMHRSRILWRWHVTHQRTRVVRPTSTLAFSFREKLIFNVLGWLLPLAGLSHVVDVTWAGILAFYSFYFFTSAGAHSNFEASPRGLPGFGTATGHAMHHARIHGNYGFFTTIHDRLFGTFWHDTLVLHGRVVAGEPLRSLNERDATIANQVNWERIR